MMGVLLFASLQAKEIQDPYKDIEYFVLNNGMQVYLLSNEKSTNTNISMSINVGFDIEDDNTYGLSHLVEHMIFRDKRVPHRDYLDYMKDEGASYVNGYTSRYNTELLTKIDSNKSYWVVKTFAKMIFDKEVDEVDIEVEKGAVQVEIGDGAWYDRFAPLFQGLGKLAPPRETIFNTHFGLKPLKDLPSYFVEKSNNKKFTLKEVMQHYHTYYYPANMILKVAGNFDVAKMKQLIQKSYGTIDTEGTARTHKPKRDAKLSHRPYRFFRNGLFKNYGYIGTQYLFDDCQKHIILTAFMDFAAKKIQQKLRNKAGKSYTVSTYSNNSRGAGIVAVSFDGLHDDFDENIKIVKETIKTYVSHMDESMIQEALDEYGKRYSAVEYDSDSLSNRIDKAEHMRSDHHIANHTHYDFFKSITPQKFRKVLVETFIPENSYENIYRDYYLFKGDSVILGFVVLFMVLFFYFRFSHYMFALRGVGYSKRDIIFSERIANRLCGFMVFMFITFAAGMLYDWIVYLVLHFMMHDSNYLRSLDLPYSFFVDLIENIMPIVLMLAIYRWLVRYHARIDVTSQRVYIVGSKPVVIEKSDVLALNVVPWRLRDIFGDYGCMLFFWKPLLKIETKTDSYHIRSSDATALKNVLIQRWIEVG